MLKARKHERGMVYVTKVKFRAFVISCFVIGFAFAVGTGAGRGAASDDAGKGDTAE
jgi:hypothetical protein